MADSRKKICIIINVDWFALSHFKHYLSTLVLSGSDVTLLTTDTGKFSELSDLGLTLVELDLHRGYSGLISELKQFKSILTVLRDIKPDALELITIKPVIYGGLCARLLKLKATVFYMSGLGSQFTSSNVTGRAKRLIFLKLYRFLMADATKKIIVENNDDYNLFVKQVGVDHKNLYRLQGVGVNLERYSPLPKRQNEKINVVMVSRLLHDKGVMEFYQAAKEITATHDKVSFHLVGGVDPTNPASLKKSEADTLNDDPAIKLHGQLNEINVFLKTQDIFVLPSYREGFPRAIMEASAMGIPVIATDVVGCRDAVVEKYTGLLCRPRELAGLVSAIELLIMDKKLRLRLGEGGRRHALNNFDEQIISKKHLKIFEEIFAD
jgi:glycosyltransferase involved in cell wall biosynthesis